jgi:hypothetical protein
MYAVSSTLGQAVPGIPHHITQRGDARRFILKTGTVRSAYLVCSIKACSNTGSVSVHKTSFRKTSSGSDDRTRHRVRNPVRSAESQVVRSARQARQRQRKRALIGKCNRGRLSADGDRDPDREAAASYLDRCAGAPGAGAEMADRKRSRPQVDHCEARIGDQKYKLAG